jgi:hypothetical protein
MTGMTDFAEVWSFSNERLAQAIEGLDDRQMSWRLYDGGHCIFEYLYHIAGAEHYWSSRMAGVDPNLTELGGRLDAAVRAGFLRDGQFPFGEDDFRRDLVESALAWTHAAIAPIIGSPTQQQLSMQLESPLGPMVTGRGGLIRLAQHAAYHTGQIWMIRLSPEFPG